MLCKKYLNMTSPERIEFIGKLLHAVQNSNQCMIIAEAIILTAEQTGIFDGVVINPKPNQDDAKRSNS